MNKTFVIFRKSPFKVTFESCMGLVFMVMGLVFVNILRKLVIDNFYFDSIVEFVNSYFFLCLLAMAIGYVADLIKGLIFPLNLPSVLIHAGNSLLHTYIGLKFARLLGEGFGLGFFEKLANSDYVPLIYIGLFVLVSFGVFLDCFSSVFKKKECHGDGEKVIQAFKNAAKEFKRTMEE